MPPGFKTIGKYIMESSTVHLRRVLDIYCQIDSSQCLAQLTPARVGKARSVHVQLGASPHVIRLDIVCLSPQSHTAHDTNTRRSPVLSDTTCPSPNMPTRERRPQRWRLRTRKLAKTNQSPIPNSQHWNNEWKKQRSC